jgi:Arc/MetJ-type ribon-helix-helix transcriptional regulator
MKNISVRIPEELIEALEMLVEQEERTSSDLIRRAIADYCYRMLS